MKESIANGNHGQNGPNLNHLINSCSWNLTQALKILNTILKAGDANGNNHVVGRVIGAVLVCQTFSV